MPSINILTILSLGLAATALAVPTKRDTPDSTYHGVSLGLVTSAPGEPKAESPAPVEINVLTSLNDFSCYSIEFQTSVHPNVDVSKVECRAYKDAEGQIPASAPFNYQSPAELSTNLVTVGSVLCYIVEDLSS